MAEQIAMNATGVLTVSDSPIIPFIEGDGTGVDIWPATTMVLDAPDDIVRALGATFADTVVTYDVARLMEGATEVTGSEFGSAIVDRL